MITSDRSFHLNRREMLRLATAGALSTTLPMAHAAPLAKPASRAGNLYADLLKTWCDGLLPYQVGAMQGPALQGALLCPACALIHGRCGDAVYPLLHMAHTTGDAKYRDAALQVYDWTERQVSRADGSWINDVVLSNWQGITVFHTISVAEALNHHGDVLDAKTRARWTDRVARAAKFLDGFLTIETGNINYPITGAYCLALCGEMLGEAKYAAHARQLAHAALEHIGPTGLIYGEGHPLDGITPRGCRPVDLGYNVEESLPALAMYSLLTKDQAVLDRTIVALRTHMEFMLPDGGWDNSWGSRNYKWTYWGSRTSDGCQPAYALLAAHDPRFAEVARRNTELMAECTHAGLLYGGPHYAEHGDDPCIHHTFTHAKALATVLDRHAGELPPQRVKLPRDEAYTVKSFPELATHLASIGDWRATVTAYDWEYVEHVQTGGSTKSGGGHATGGALSMLYHQRLGPIIAASMTKYQMIEISNQQGFRDGPHMTLTPRIECSAAEPFTSLSDNTATLKLSTKPGEQAFLAEGLLQMAFHQMPPVEARYELHYRVIAEAVEITATVHATSTLPGPLQLIVPIVSASSEKVTRTSGGVIRIAKPKGATTVRTTSKEGFAASSMERTFNLIPGLEALPVTILMTPNEPVTLRIEAA